MSDERWRLLEAAFAKVQPKDDAEREWLERKKERMRALSIESANELARHFEEQAARKADFEITKGLARERDAIYQESRDALLAAMDEQADLIEGIIRQTAR